METSKTAYKTRLAAFKMIIKSFAEFTKKGKIIHKECQRAQSYEGYATISKLCTDMELMWLSRFSARTLHYAYSLAKGRTAEQIEQKVTEGNEINLRLVDEILQKVMGLNGLPITDNVTEWLSDDELLYYQTLLKAKYAKQGDDRYKNITLGLSFKRELFVNPFNK